MKKNIFICTLFISYSFNITSEQKDDFLDSIKKPNKPKIINHLPEEAYQQIYETFKNNFSAADTEFIMFLQNRYKRNVTEKYMTEEDILIKNLSKNFINSQTLNTKYLSECGFAAGVQSLYLHQLIADTRSYPCNRKLTPFEQQYSFKLYAINFYKFMEFIDSLPESQKLLYKQAVIKNFAKYLLITLSRR